MKIRFSRTSKTNRRKKYARETRGQEIASRAKEKEFEDKSTNNRTEKLKKMARFLQMLK
jgi:hypothetical protein